MAELVESHMESMMEEIAEMKRIKLFSEEETKYKTIFLQFSTYFATNFIIYFQQDTFKAEKTI